MWLQKLVANIQCEKVLENFEILGVNFAFDTGDYILFGTGQGDRNELTFFEFGLDQKRSVGDKFHKVLNSTNDWPHDEWFPVNVFAY